VKEVVADRDLLKKQLLHDDKLQEIDSKKGEKHEG
jgi:hypothetical protein